MPPSEPPLTLNEKTVLWALTRWPSANDRQLAYSTGIKMSTITAIRNRLKRAGKFQSVRIPIMTRLGCELLKVACYRLTPAKDPKSTLKELKSILAHQDPCFYAFADRFQLLTMSFHKNFTDLFLAEETLRAQFHEQGFVDPESYHTVQSIFPLELTRLINIFDFSNLVRKRFNLKDKANEPPTPPAKFPSGPIHLSNIEKKVYQGLIANPDIVDNSIAKKIGVTRQSVTKIRRRLQSEGLLLTAKLPDLEALGSQIVAFAHYRLKEGANLQKRKKALAWTVKELPGFFQVANDREGVILGLARDFPDTQDHIYNTLSLYHKEGFLAGEPRIMLFAVRDLNVIKDFVFGPIVDNVLVSVKKGR